MTEEKSEHRKPLPPYISFKTFLSFLDGLKVAVPTHIDRSIMKSLSGGTQSGLMNALSYMGLMESDNAPTERLRALVRANGVERQQLFGDLWADTYQNLGVDFDTTTSKQLEDALGKEGISGDTVLKAKVFLQNLAKAGGVTLSPHLKAGGHRSRPKTVRRQNNAPEQPHEHAIVNATCADMRRPEEMLLDILNPVDMPDDVQMAIWTVIKYLKVKAAEEE